MAKAKVPDTPCSVARSLGVLGERWTFLILREALVGSTRFSEFRDVLRVAPDVLTERLNTLVEYGVMTREPYKEPGSRQRYAYGLTPAGRELQIVLSSLEQWGDKHLPWHEGPSIVRRRVDTGESVHIGFIDEHGREVDRHELALLRTEAHPRGPSELPAPSPDGLTGVSAPTPR